MNSKEFRAIRIFPSSRGLHCEFATKEEAQAFYERGLEVGARHDELIGSMVIIFTRNEDGSLRS